jgi:hypothetical protein
MTTGITDRINQQFFEQDASHPVRHPLPATSRASEIDEAFKFSSRNREVV